ncbi:protein NOI4 isoform X2 [Quercus lobata]|uniref:protein NOI4 isoform X2 n=1 Tax=Quercus lobata TaxID=97700 RepID=UPI0012491823|nr:protein NOI4 isoform X2 [Quercus lobata]
MSDKGQPLPKFGEWDVNDPASAEGFTVIFNKARDEKKTGGKPESPGKGDSQIKPGVDTAKPQASTVVLKESWSCITPQGYSKDFS